MMCMVEALTEVLSDAQLEIVQNRIKSNWKLGEVRNFMESIVPINARQQLEIKNLKSSGPATKVSFTGR